jgi:hypothetical protein
MDDGFFAEFDKGIKNAWQVSQGAWTLYSGPCPPVLIGSAPAVPFRVAITLISVTDHTTVAGDVLVNDEILTFTEATRMTNGESLSALPDVSTDGPDCDILIEAISVSGAPLYHEVLTPIEVIVFPKTQLMRDPSGTGWQQTDYQIFTEAALKIGDQIRFADPHQSGHAIDVYVKNVSSAVDLEDLSQPFRVLSCA